MAMGEYPETRKEKFDPCRHNKFKGPIRPKKVRKSVVLEKANLPQEQSQQHDKENENQQVNRKSQRRSTRDYTNPWVNKKNLTEEEQRRKEQRRRINAQLDKEGFIRPKRVRHRSFEIHDTYAPSSRTGDSGRDNKRDRKSAPVGRRKSVIDTLKKILPKF